MRVYKNQSVSHSDPLSLTLSRWGEGTFTTPSGRRVDFCYTLLREKGLLQHPPQGEGELSGQQ